MYMYIVPCTSGNKVSISVNLPNVINYKPGYYTTPYLF